MVQVHGRKREISRCCCCCCRNQEDTQSIKGAVRSQRSIRSRSAKAVVALIVTAARCSFLGFCRKNKQHTRQSAVFAFGVQGFRKLLRKIAIFRWTGSRSKGGRARARAKIDNLNNPEVVSTGETITRVIAAMTLPSKKRERIESQRGDPRPLSLPSKKRPIEKQEKQ